MKRLIATVSTLAALGITGFMVSAQAASASTRISGQVVCEDGLSVEGIWIATSSGSGFANWSSPGGGDYANFNYSLPRSEAWTVHVGCGGSKSSWRYPTNGNTTTTRANQSWTCYSADIAYYPFCQEG